MERPQFAFTGPTPEKGYVGYINIKETDGGVQFTVRSQGESPVTAAYEISLPDAIELLQNALEGLGNDE